MAGVQNGPVPTTLTLLSELPKFVPGTKVRFLGWSSIFAGAFPLSLQTHSITNYSTKTATLTLEHNYPPGQTLRALVNIDLILNTIKSHETRTGEWVNVMGYIQAESQPKHSVINESGVPVQAIVLWSSSSLNLQTYERSLDQQKTSK
ncbi:hypothetical protein LHYA1_G009040 [Lachnellula hyalina]|uniref:Uncharacterized protein n=1 Tax=Lachnellula hyalina TaxID=1316788 RepID=A0A8H8QTI2_9HELO|nr:uncharacterized protein LHYA1_G009040 [Lachnellula hyalina]TVY22261.1 hypothetical protein LHYA1_G009040 [Lachnellula hyalina]